MIVNVELYSFFRFSISKGKKSLSESVVLFMFVSLGRGWRKKSESLKKEKSGNEKTGG